MERLGKVSASFTKGGKKAQSLPKVVESASAWMGFDELMPESARQLSKRLRPQLESDRVYKRMLDYIESGEFPQDMVPIVRELDIGKYFYSGEYGAGKDSSPWDKVVILLELGRVDCSLGTFFMVQHVLLGKTIDMFGSEEQKKEFLPKIRDLELIGGWGLTELNVGSDASSMETRVRFENGEYILNGNKRWIGNANKDIMCVFAKDEKTEEVQCFILDLKWPGIQRESIKRKMALRPVQNMQLEFKDVRIPAKYKLPGVKGFASVATLLAESRIMVGWLAAAAGLGLYDYMIQYLRKRIQFGNPLVSYQLIQEKVFKVMSRVQANLFFVYNVQQLHLAGKATIGQIAMCKAFVTEMLREAARFGREALGGNGIIADNHVMKVLVDAEVLFTYEGTYDINLMVAGRELTGVAAFKTR
jgi:acyl-CoA oxidase